jgi:hypothetical protein
MMWRWIALIALLATAAVAADQPLNNFIVPTAPLGTSNNQAASTAFVAGQISALTRIKLTANLTLNSNFTLGTDTPTCGLGTGAAACKTVNYVYNNILVPNYDTAGKTLTISFVADDSTCVTLGTAWTGAGLVVIQGPGGTTPSVGLTCTGTAVTVNAPLPAALFLIGFKCSGGTTCVFSQTPGLIGINNINFGAESFAHILLAGPGAKVGCSGNYTISGGSTYHWIANTPGAFIACQNVQLTLTGTPAFSFFAYAVDGGGIQPFSTTYSGSATGAKFFAGLNGLIDTGTGNINTLPGNSAGSTSLGGQYN